MTIARPMVRGIARPMARPLVEGVGGVPFASILALGPQLAVSLNEPGSLFQERSDAASTPSAVGDRVGTVKNWGVLGLNLIAPTDSARPFLRATANGKRYLEGDGVDDALTRALSALRGVSGWTIVLGIRFPAVTSLPFFVSGSGNASARATFVTGATGIQLGGRRENADSFATTAFGGTAGADVVLVGTGDYTNTRAALYINRSLIAQNTSWLTAGVTPNDGGGVALFSNASGTASWMAGRIFSSLLYPTVLSPAGIALAETWTAEQIGISI